ncbi:MAG: glycine/sarcosine/betaine reductase selenoprotein B family protein [Candidatus Binatia bacterium]
MPWAELKIPLSGCRVALGSSGGLYRAAQRPFHFKDDTSIRVLPTDVSTESLRVAHFGYPTDGAREDPNCVFPLDRVRELVADGTLGELAPQAITFMGGIYSQRRVEEELVPAVIAELERQAVDLFYLVPA